MLVDTALGYGLVLAGAVLLLVEIIHPGAFLLIPGSVMLAGGILYLLLPDVLLGTIWGPAVVAIVALAATVATVPLYQRVAPNHPPIVTTPSSLAGRTGLVIVDVRPDSLKGKVRVDSEIWSARAEEHIPSGTRVRILGGEGVSVRVEPVAPGGS